MEIKNPSNLIAHIKSTVDLPLFIEQESGVSFNWLTPGQEAVCNCPFSNHDDSNASFRINLMENNVWIFHCFGCGTKGSVIDYCMNQYSYSFGRSLHYICEKLDIKDDISTQALDRIKANNRKVNMNRRMELSNIMVSDQCRMLLTKDFKQHKEWVSNAYKLLNQALADEDYNGIEQIGFEASKRSRI